MTSDTTSTTQDPASVGDPSRWRLGRRATLVLAAVMTVLLAAVITVVVVRPPAPTPIPDPGDVRSADDLVDSMGVAVHLYQEDEQYDLFAATLSDLGVRHIRTGGTGREFFAHVNALYEDHGIKSLLVMDPRDGYAGDTVVERGVLPVLDALDGVEGPNEWDINRTLQYEGETWPQGVVRFGDEMYDAIKQYRDDDEDVQEAVRGLTVASPTVADPAQAGRLGGVRCDVAAMHSYPGGKLPDQDLTSKWLPSALQLCGGRGVIATESGYCNTLTPEGCTNQGGVSQEASAKYALRHYLDYFLAGIQRDYLYNLSTNDWDLFLEQDGTRKPAFYAVRSAVALLSDAGPTYHPTRLDLQVSGADDVQHVLLQKRDGSYWLGLWTNAISYPAGQACCDLDTAREVTVALPRAMTATVYSPTFEGTDPVDELAASRTLRLSVPDQVLLVRLTG